MPAMEGHRMGRRVPSFSQCVEQERRRWAPFRRALSAADQAVFDRLGDQLGDHSSMNAPKIQALGITQQGSSTRWKATGYVEGAGWLEAWGTTLIVAMFALGKKC